MKKLFKVIAILGMVFIGASIFAQQSYATVDKYQAKYTEEDWGEWLDITGGGTMIIYLDMGFGFMSITNSQFDRFILTKMEEPVETEKKITYVFEAINAVGVNSKIYYTYTKESDSFTLTITYDDMQYSYLLKEDFDGYPSKLFGTDESGIEPSPEPRKRDKSKFNSTQI